MKAAATEAEIDVYGSVAWTATVTGGDATIAEPAGGNGNGSGKVKITFPANTSKDNANTYTVTISTADAAVTTTAQQANTATSGLFMLLFIGCSNILPHRHRSYTTCAHNF